jgi:4'-phosphopantetheinyl transferase EntD
VIEGGGGHPVLSDGAALNRACAALSSEQILVDARPISAGDETALLPEEAASIASQAMHARRASGAARIVARALLGRLGFHDCAIPKSSSGAPRWPDGIVGSLAHDDEVAAAAVAFSRDIAALGIDIEPAQQLPSELRDLVLTQRERAQADDGFGGRVVFAVKEAVYKAIAALDGTLLDYQDIETDLATYRARIADGRCLALRYSMAPRLIVLAFIPRV